MFPAAFNQGGGAQAGQQAPIVEFKAGKLSTNPRPNGKLLVTAVRGRGQVVLVRAQGTTRFQWRNRADGKTEEDILVLPNDAKFQKVDTGRQDDRVYLLEYKDKDNKDAEPKRKFFWMQDKNSDKDEENVKKLNAAMNNPTQSSDATDGSNMDQNSLLPILGGFNSGGAGGSGGNVQMADLQNILRSMGMEQGAGGDQATPGTPDPVAQRPSTDSTSGGEDGMMEDDLTEEEMIRLAIEESMKTAAESESKDNEDNDGSGDKDDSNTNA